MVIGQIVNNVCYRQVQEENIKNFDLDVVSFKVFEKDC